MTRKLSTGLHSYDVPSDWDIGPVGNYVTIETGARNTQDRVSGGKFPFFVRSQTVERINTYSFDGEAVLTAGDGVGTGKIFHYINGRFDCHQRVYRMSEFVPELDGRYFYWFFSRFFYERVISMTAKSSVDSVRRDMIFEMDLALPSYAEQKGISQSLDDLNFLIECLDKLISKKRDIKQGTMQQLLTGKTRLPGFSGEWNRTSLGQLGDFRKGRGIRKDEVLSYGLACVRYGEIYTRFSNTIETCYSFISEKTSRDSEPLLKGDVVFTVSGETSEEIGKCATFLGDFEAYVGSDTLVMRPKSNDPTFLGYFLNFGEILSQKQKLGQGDAVVHLSLSNLSAVTSAIPTLAEQIAIAQVLSDMDAEIDALVARREKTALIKTGMMQELLTGRTRLI